MRGGLEAATVEGRGRVEGEVGMVEDVGRE